MAPSPLNLQILVLLKTLSLCSFKALSLQTVSIAFQPTLGLSLILHLDIDIETEKHAIYRHFYTLSPFKSRYLPYWLLIVRFFDIVSAFYIQSICYGCLTIKIKEFEACLAISK